MSSRILLGLGRHMIPIPRWIWRRAMQANGRRLGASVRFMSDDHHRVRDFAVTELARTGAPLSPERIAEALALALPRVTELLDDLEAHLTFVYRSRGRDVTWAYPVTVDATPHHAAFTTGEEAFSP